MGVGSACHHARPAASAATDLIVAVARLPRAVVPGELHLVIHRGQSGQPVFLTDDDRRRYLDALRTAARETQTAIHAYALLPGEVRLLATPPTAGALATLMQAVGRRYVKGFNQAHGRTGTPWEGRFRSTVVEADTHFLACLRFVESSLPLGAEAAAADAAPSSSAAHHMGVRADPLITEHPAFWALGNTPFDREAGYRRLLDEPLPAMRHAEIADAGAKGWALGSTGFKERVADMTGRRATPAVRGRPRKNKSVPI